MRRTESVTQLLPELYLRDRGLRAPVLMMADGALPIWSAVDQVWPETAQQRCWNHKIMNVLDDLPKRGQGKARALLTQIPTADTRAQAEARRDKFAARYKDRYPKAVATLERVGSAWSPSTTFPSSIGGICARRIQWRVPLRRYACGPTPANATSEYKVPRP